MGSKQASYIECSYMCTNECAYPTIPILINILARLGLYHMLDARPHTAIHRSCFTDTVFTPTTHDVEIAIVLAPICVAMAVMVLK